MKASVLNEEGKALTMVMGCYGMGISRLVGAAIEQNNDEHGIIWPESIAPFTAVLIPSMLTNQKLFGMSQTPFTMN